MSKGRSSLAKAAKRVAPAVLTLCVVGVVGVVGCVDADRPLSRTTSAHSDVVTSHLALSLPEGSTIDSVSYRVLSSGGATLLAGTIDVSQRGATLSLDLVLAPTLGDVAELSAQTSAGASCAGTSAPFDVVAGRPTFINLTLVCGGNQRNSNSCPDIESWTVAPVQAAAPDGLIDVAVAVNNPAAELSYAWIATAGSFADPSAASTVYRCTTVGAQTLTLTVSDQQSSPACAATATFLVGCSSTTDAEIPAETPPP